MQITTTLGELARANPASTRVFLRHRLDFCCGGKRTLAEACATAGLDATAIAAELDAATARSPQTVRWDQRSPAELADHIEGHYHEGLRRDMPPLIEAARKVERVHAGKLGVPAGLADLLAAFYAEMEHHMMKEEYVLFPLIRRGGHGEAAFMPVRMMEHEHDTHREHLQAIRRITGDMLLPPEACATWRALYHGLATMEAELMEHIHLENNVLFPRVISAAR